MTEKIERQHKHSWQIYNDKGFCKGCGIDFQQYRRDKLDFS